MSLTPEEVARFDRDGILGPIKLLEPDEAVELRRRVVAEVKPKRAWTYAHTTSDFPSHCDFQRDRHLDSPLVYRLCSHRALVDRLLPLLGPNVLLWRSDFFDRGPEDPVTYPHQDHDMSSTRNIPLIAKSLPARPIGSSTQLLNTQGWPLCVSAWIALTRVKSNSGALWLAPGSHRDGMIAEVPGAGLPGRPFKMGREFSEEERFHVDLQPGECILFHNFTVHGSIPVAGGDHRFAITARFVSTDTYVHPHGTEMSAQGQELSRFGSILVAGADNKRNILRAPPPLGSARLVEDAAVVDFG